MARVNRDSEPGGVSSPAITWMLAVHALLTLTVKELAALVTLFQTVEALEASPMLDATFGFAGSCLDGDSYPSSSMLVREEAYPVPVRMRSMKDDADENTESPSELRYELESEGACALGAGRAVGIGGARDEVSLFNEARDF